MGISQRVRGRPLADWTLIAVGCLLLAAPQASADWSAALSVSPASQYSEQAVAATDADGDDAVAWVHRIAPEEASIEVARRPAGGAFGAAVTVSSETLENIEPSVAVGEEGQVAVAWTQEEDGEHTLGEVVRVSFGSVDGGSFSAPVTISAVEPGTGQEHPRIAIVPSGEVLVVWAGLDDSVHYAARPPGASDFSAPRAVANPGSDLFDPVFAIAPDGAAVAAWTDYSHIYAATRPAAGAFGSAQTVLSAACAPTTLNAASGENAEAVLTWIQTDSHCDGGVSPSWVKASYSPAGGSFGAPATVAEMGAWAQAGGVAISPTGTVTASCLGDMLSPSSTAPATALTRASSGAWGHPQPIMQEAALNDIPALAYDGAGDLFALDDTRESQQGSGSPVSGILASSARAGGSFSGANEALQSVEGEVDSMPVLAAAGSGDAIAAWSAAVIDEHSTVQVATLEGQAGASEPPAPPPVASTGAPVAPTGTPSSSATPTFSTSPSPSGASASATSPLQPPTPAPHPTQPAPKPAVLRVAGSAGRARSVRVRLLHDGHVLRSALAHVARGRYHADLSLAGLSRGPYLLEVVLLEGSHTRRARHRLQLT